MRIRATLSTLAAGSVLAAAMLAQPALAGAASFTLTVNTTADGHDADPGNGVCGDASGACTLRAALEETDALPTGSVVTVHLPAGHYVLTLGNLSASKNTITIDGAGSASTSVDAQLHSQILVVSPGAVVALNGFTLRAGAPTFYATYGGAVLNAGSLTISQCVVTASTATAGGGVANAGGTLTVQDSVLSNNIATAYGGGAIQNGGIQNLPGNVTMEKSLLENNSASGDGGAILNGQNGHPSSADRLPPAFGQRAPGVQDWREFVGPHARRLVAWPTVFPEPAGAPSLTVAGSVVASNSSDNAGGGIASDGGTAVVKGSALRGNNAHAGVGGDISTYGALTITASSIDSGSASYGGGIEAFTGGEASSLNVAESTLAGNSALAYGGAIDDSSNVSVWLSTLAANRAGNGGGALEIEGATATVANSTLYGNSEPAGGGAVSTYACGGGTLAFDTIDHNTGDMSLSCSNLVLLGTIVSGATAGPNCVGAIPAESNGFNLDSGTSCGLSKPTDISNANPDLGPLAANGGPTLTEALLAGSPAINAGGQRSTGCPSTDQRGVPRPQGPACDIGAFEVVSPGANRGRD